MDGWTTDNSQGRKPACLFGCTLGRDNIRHYAYCPRLTELARTKLNMPPGEAEQRLDRFLLLEPRYTEDEVSQLACGAFLLYVPIKATNSARHGHFSSAAESWTQYLREDAAGHPKPAEYVGSLWMR